MNWQPIETAPRDGTVILLWDKRGLAITGWWHNDPGRDDPSGYEPPWSWWVSDLDLILWDDGEAPLYWAPFEPPTPSAPYTP